MVATPKTFTIESFSVVSSECENWNDFYRCDCPRAFPVTASTYCGQRNGFNHLHVSAQNLLDQHILYFEFSMKSQVHVHCKYQCPCYLFLMEKSYFFFLTRASRLMFLVLCEVG